MGITFKVHHTQKTIGHIHNLFTNSDLGRRRNAGWLQLSAFLGSFPEIRKGSRRVPGSKLFKQVFSAADYYYEFPMLEEVALAEM